MLGRIGRNGEAMASYDRALELAPHSAEAWFGRGMTLLAMGRVSEAITSFERVLAVKPDLTQVHLLRAKLQTDLGRHDAALEGIDKLLALMPALAEAWLGRSNILFAAKRYPEALSAVERALELKPDLAEAWHGRGNVLNELRQYEQALAAYDKALALNRNFAGAWHGRGNVLSEVKRHQEALGAYDKALTLAPDLTAAWLGRGNVLNLLKQLPEALIAYDRALTLDPNLAEAWLGRGNAFCELNRYADAGTAYDKAISIDAGLAEAWLGRGKLLITLKRHDEALAAYDRAVAVKPDLKYAKGDRLHVKLTLSDWTDLDNETIDLVSQVREKRPAISPFQFLAISTSAADQLACTRTFMTDQLSFPAIWRGEIYSHDPIRIAYLSADFHEHATAYLMAGLFEKHDKARFDVTAISFGPNQNSQVRERIIGAVEHFIDARSKSDQQIAELIRRLEIDIVIDLKGFTHDARYNVLARRAAPVQVNYLGYPGTMGADFMDYVIADSTIIPKEQFPCYPECVVWLPDSYQVNDQQRRISERCQTRRECGLPESAFVYCCFNNPYKILPDIFDIWMRLLRSNENSVLWLIEGHPTAAANLRCEAEKRNVSAERLIFAPKIPLPDHLARHRHIDLFLDTLPYNAHTTASDALWAGIPVLTRLGTTFAGGVAGSVLKAVGLDELITHSLEEYEAMATQLAQEPSRLAELKDRLARNRNNHPLFNTERFAHHIEDAFLGMWQRYQRGEPPEAFVVGELA